MSHSRVELDVALVGGPIEELAAARGTLQAVGAVTAVVGRHVAPQRPLLPVVREGRTGTLEGQYSARP